MSDIRILIPAPAIGKKYPMRNSEKKKINRHVLYAFEEIAIIPNKRDGDVRRTYSNTIISI